MDPASRRAWTQIVTPSDYERHMATVGQAEAAAKLTRALITAAEVARGGRVYIVGAGTGQLLDFVDAESLRSFRLTFTDLSSSFLNVLRARLAKHGLDATVMVDDAEQTQLPPAPDLVLASLLLEHIDWRRGVSALTNLRPKACGFIIQVNPPGMTSAVTPGRSVPPSLAEAMTVAHPTLVDQVALVEDMVGHGYRTRVTDSVAVADGKHLVGLLFGRRPGTRPKSDPLQPGVRASRGSRMRLPRA